MRGCLSVLSIIVVLTFARPCVAAAQEPAVAVPAPTIAALRARIDALDAPREGETDLLAAAERALERAATDRAAGDTAAAERAERIADAGITLIETRRRRAEAEATLAAARARRAEIAARAAAARETHESDVRERDRLAPPPASPTP
jgi:hypothetical protein